MGRSEYERGTGDNGFYGTGSWGRTTRADAHQLIRGHPVLLAGAGWGGTGKSKRKDIDAIGEDRRTDAVVQGAAGAERVRVY